MLVEEGKPVAYSKPMLAGRNTIMSSALIRTAHSPALAGKWLIAMCTAKNDSVPLVGLRKESAWRVWLSAAEYAEAFGVDANTAREQLQGASDNLFNRYVRTVRETHRGPKESKFHWVGSARYHKGEGWIELVWFQGVAPHLFGLRQEFTIYKLRQAAALHPVYTWCPFECLKSWVTTSRYTPTTEELHRAMNASESQRKNFRDLRRRVIELTVKELWEKSGLYIEWEPETAGRKVVGLDLQFHVSPRGALL